MGKTLSEVIEDLRANQHELTVWGKIVEFLADFVDQDDSPAKLRMTAEGSISEVISPAIVQRVITKVYQDHVMPLKEAVEALKSLEVPSERD